MCSTACFHYQEPLCFFSWQQKHSVLFCNYEGDTLTIKPLRLSKRFFKEECNNPITHRRKKLFLLGGRLRSKNYFSTFFKTQEHFGVLMSLYIWREKYFFQKPKPNIIDSKNFFKPFDKFRIDKFFLLMYNSPVNTDVKS